LNDKKYCFFFVMEGNCKFRLTYPYTKWVNMFIIN
jgi:hypothetical protein